MNRIILFTTSGLILIAAMGASQDQDKPCSTPEFRQFDFWVGEWNLTWGDSGKGINSVTHELGDCVIEENFAAEPEGSFIGRSVSTYDVKSHQWKQTWVDNNGAYLDFVGRWMGDRMVLWREAPSDSGVFLQRMVWYAIASDSLEWNWEKSTDGGTTWNVLWNIHYKRAQ